MANLNSIAEDLSKLTVLEAAELAKILEDKWGVSAAAPAAVMMPSAGAAADTVAEKDSFDVVLVNVGSSKIAVIKEVRAITGLGLAEAKALVDGAPKPIKTELKKADAEELKKKLEDIGATIELK